ncbi:hypothetical protein XENTR_v10018605, partial [Xenopus tropicalis]
MLGGDINESLPIPELQIPNLTDCTSSSSSSTSYTLNQRHRRFKMRRSKCSKTNETRESLDSIRNSEYLQLPSIEITPSSDEDSTRSNSSTPSTSPRRHSFKFKNLGTNNLKEGNEPENQGQSES